MNFDKQKLKETITEIQKGTAPLFEVDMKKWAVRANLPSANKPIEKLESDKHLGMPLAERVMHHLWRELPLEGVSYHVVESGELLADFSDLAPVFLMVRCIDEDTFDLEVIDDTNQMVLSLEGQNLRQLVDTIREMHQAALMALQRTGLNEGTNREEEFFKSKYEALKRVCNQAQPFR